jgi:hypothetical protein
MKVFFLCVRANEILYGEGFKVYLGHASTREGAEYNNQTKDNTTNIILYIILRI